MRCIKFLLKLPVSPLMYRLFQIMFKYWPAHAVIKMYLKKYLKKIAACSFLSHSERGVFNMCTRLIVYQLHSVLGLFIVTSPGLELMRLRVGKTMSVMPINTLCTNLIVYSGPVYQFQGAGYILLYQANCELVS